MSQQYQPGRQPGDPLFDGAEEYAAAMHDHVLRGFATEAIDEQNMERVLADRGLSETGSPSPIERAMYAAGLAVGATRAPMVPLSRSAADVIAERARQQSAEGWTPKHDDAHNDGALALAASAYAMPNAIDGYAPRQWPFSMAWWKPTTPRRNLVKAGALILAEIERLDRSSREE